MITAVITAHQPLGYSEYDYVIEALYNVWICAAVEDESIFLTANPLVGVCHWTSCAMDLYNTTLALDGELAPGFAETLPQRVKQVLY